LSVGARENRRQTGSYKNCRSSHFERELELKAPLNHGDAEALGGKIPKIEERIVSPHESTFTDGPNSFP
jgi:hypothetical protein